MIPRRKTRTIQVGPVAIGGSAPIAIQSMTKTPTADVRATVNQVRALEGAGCEIVRVAVKTAADADAIRRVRAAVRIPVVADIHFDYRLALRAIAGGADKVRLNPGNITDDEGIRAVVRAAKKAHIPIRIGVNSGSVAPGGRRGAGSGGDVVATMVHRTLGYVRIFEAMRFRDIVLSLKASDVVATVEAYTRIARRTDYPLHLGVTAAGPYDSGIVKSSIGIGALLMNGIGDTIRVSLTADPLIEVAAARQILSALGLRRFGPEIVSCPTCGRCQVDLGGIVKRIERELSAVNSQPSVKKKMTIAIMGCEVNGPGEAREADIGVAFGKESGVVFKAGKVVKRVREKDAIRELMRLVHHYEQEQ